MSKLTLTIGGILVVVGVVAYVVTGAASVTALIPAIVGVVLLACGAVAGSTRFSRVGLGAAMVIALLGAAGALQNVIELPDLFAGTAEVPSAVITSTIMLVLLLFYLVMGTRALVLARRSAASSP